MRATIDRRAVFGTARLRAASFVAVLAWLALWHVKTTGTVTPAALVLLGTCMLAALAFGALFMRFAGPLLAWPIGLALELLAGFLIGATLLFVLTLVTPLGMALNLALTGLVACAGLPALFARRPVSSRHVQAERASLACIVVSGLAATLWVQDQQPLVSMRGDSAVYTVWFDVFIHAREISAFALAHGLSTVSDIKLAGVPAAAYHFASYMVPAALDALANTSALNAYAAFQLPFGLFLTGLAGYVLVAGVLRTTWPAMLASAAVLALPDAYQQGFGVRMLSFQFMTQVNLGMLYGLGCMALSWLFMIEGCRRNRLAGVAIAYGFLVVCLTYKAQLFVANALILMLYPCVVFGTFRWWWRVLAALALLALFVKVVAISQMSPRVPVLRLDGSSFGGYVDILRDASDAGWMKSLFASLYYRQHWPAAINFLLGSTFILVGSFGLWIFAAPFVARHARARTDTKTAAREVVHALGFVALILVNYMVMSTLLAFDDRGVGQREEFLNRPHAWAYFVVVLFTVGLALRRVRWPRWLLAPVAVAALLLVNAEARDLQTFPSWDGYADYAQFNAMPACLVRAARYVRDHAASNDVLLDGGLDERIRVSAIAQRQSWVSDAVFGGQLDVVEARKAEVAAMKSSHDMATLAAFGRDRRIAWYVMHPADNAGWDARALDRAAFRCGDYRVFSLAR